MNNSGHTFAVCAYRESPFLQECIQSLKNQSTSSNILICTSTPNDAIERIAAKENLKVLINTGERGIASDWNFAIASAPTTLVTIAHQDDIYCPDYCSHMLASFNTHVQPLIFFSNYGEIRKGEYVDENQLLQVKRRLVSPMLKQRNASLRFHKRNILRFGSAICCPSVTYNKSTIPLPLFESGMKGGLDWGAWEKLSRIPGSFCYDPEILMYHRIHEGSETSRIIADNTRTNEDLEILKKFWPTPVARAINRLYSKSLNSNEV